MKKISLELLEDDPLLLDYLSEELAHLSSLNNPHIAKIHEFFTEQNHKCIVYEHCQGGDLLEHQIHQPSQTFSLEEAIPILVQIIQGL